MEIFSKLLDILETIIVGFFKLAMVIIIAGVIISIAGGYLA